MEGWAPGPPRDHRGHSPGHTCRRGLCLAQGCTPGAGVRLLGLQPPPSETPLPGRARDQPCPEPAVSRGCAGGGGWGRTGCGGCGLGWTHKLPPWQDGRPCFCEPRGSAGPWSWDRAGLPAPPKGTPRVPLSLSVFLALSWCFCPHASRDGICQKDLWPAPRLGNALRSDKLFIQRPDSQPLSALIKNICKQANDRHRSPVYDTGRTEQPAQPVMGK